MDIEQYLKDLNWFDITILSIIGVSTLFATIRGFIKALFSLITWVGSAIAATLAYPYTIEYFSTKIASHNMAMAISIISAFLVAFFVIALINSRIVFSMRKISGGFLDRILGLIFGGARGVLITCLIFYTIHLASSMLHIGGNSERPGPEWFAESSSYDALEYTTNILVSYTPDDMPNRLEATLGKVKDLTIATIGDELESSSNSAQTLSQKHKDLMKEVISSLPPQELAQIYQKYDGNTSSLSEFEKMNVFYEILKTYKEQRKSGKAANNKNISPEQLQELEQLLNSNNADRQEDLSGGVGYKERNIKQMDRLIDNIQ